MLHRTCFKFFILLLVLFLIVSCKDYYNESIHWMDNLENQQNIEDVKSEQPNFIEIDWENPKTFDNQIWYMITNIKGNNDVLKMSHYLVFIDDKYQYRESKK